MNIPLGDGPYNPARDCAPSPEGDCIIAAIDRFSSILADRPRPGDERAEALTFPVHVVADLLGQPYLDASLPILKQQLLRGGVRLAALLNAIFEKAAR